MYIKVWETLEFVCCCCYLKIYFKRAEALLKYVLSVPSAFMEWFGGASGCLNPGLLNPISLC